MDRKVGSARLDLYWMSPSLPFTKPHTNIQKLSLFLSQARGGDDNVKVFFGVVSGRSEHIPGLFSRLCIMSSQYFDESLTLVLGFLYWKELGLDALIYFWTMDS